MKTNCTFALAAAALALALGAFAALAPASALAIEPGTSIQARQLLNDQFYPGGGEDGADASYKVTSTSATTAAIDLVVASPASASPGFSHAAYVHPLTGKTVKIPASDTGKKIGNGGDYAAWLYPLRVTGLKPQTSYQIPVFSVYVIDGAEVASAPYRVSATTESMSAPAPLVTKISAKKVRATVQMPAAMRDKGAFAVSLYAGSKRIKSWTSTTAASYVYSYKKKGAAKKKYHVTISWTGDSAVSATSKAVKAQANQMTWKRSTDPVSYGYSTATCVPTKLSYTKKGKLSAKVRWVNTRLALASAKVKVRITVKCQGKTIAKQTFTSAKMKRMSTKRGKLTFKKGKKGYDLRNGNVTWSVKFLSAK